MELLTPYFLHLRVFFPKFERGSRLSSSRHTWECHPSRFSSRVHHSSLLVCNSCSSGGTVCSRATSAAGYNADGASSASCASASGNNAAALPDALATTNAGAAGSAAAGIHGNAIPAGFPAGSTTSACWCAISCSSGGTVCSRATSAAGYNADGASSASCASASGNNAAALPDALATTNAGAAGSAAAGIHGNAIPAGFPAGSTTSACWCAISCSSGGTVCSRATSAAVYNADGASSASCASASGNNAAALPDALATTNAGAAGSAAAGIHGNAIPAGFPAGSTTAACWCAISCSSGGTVCSRATSAAGYNADGASSANCASASGNNAAALPDALATTNAGSAAAGIHRNAIPAGFPAGSTTAACWCAISCSSGGTACSRATSAAGYIADGASSAICASASGNLATTLPDALATTIAVCAPSPTCSCRSVSHGPARSAFTVQGGPAIAL
eukprot:jgi/Botrbrau1/13543/Bobra.4_2s0003.3